MVAPEGVGEGMVAVPVEVADNKVAPEGAWAEVVGVIEIPVPGYADSCRPVGECSGYTSYHLPV